MAAVRHLNLDLCNSSQAGGPVADDFDVAEFQVLDTLAHVGVAKMPTAQFTRMGTRLLRSLVTRLTLMPSRGACLRAGGRSS